MEILPREISKSFRTAEELIQYSISDDKTLAFNGSANSRLYI